jgi:hypothetical protein
MDATEIRDYYQSLGRGDKILFRTTVCQSIGKTSNKPLSIISFYSKMKRGFHQLEIEKIESLISLNS